MVEATKTCKVGGCLCWAWRCLGEIVLCNSLAVPSFYSFLSVLVWVDGLKRNKYFTQEVGKLNNHGGVCSLVKDYTWRVPSVNLYVLRACQLLVTCHWHCCTTIMSGRLPHLSCLGQEQKLAINWWTPKIQCYCPGHVVQLVRVSSWYAKVVGSISGQGTKLKQSKIA